MVLGYVKQVETCLLGSSIQLMSKSYITGWNMFVGFNYSTIQLMSKSLHNFIITQTTIYPVYVKKFTQLCYNTDKYNTDNHLSKCIDKSLHLKIHREITSFEIT